MINQHIRRGYTQEVVSKNKSHSRKYLSGISLIRFRNEADNLFLNKQCKQKEDPRLQASGMTPNLNIPSPRALRGPLPPGARDSTDEAPEQKPFQGSAPLRFYFDRTLGSGANYRHISRGSTATISKGHAQDAFGTGGCIAPSGRTSH